MDTMIDDMGNAELRQRRCGRAQRLTPALVAVALLTAAGCSDALPVVPDGRWNVLVLVPDTIRADHLSINGYPAPTTPELDALAREGVNFTQAITAAPRTWQSFTSILTGLYPPRHGVRYVMDHPLPAQTPTLPSILAKHGYRTAEFDPMGFLHSVTSGKQFQRHFNAKTEGEITEDAVLTTRIVDLLRNDPEQPFLFFVRFNGAHWSYNRDDWIEEFEACSGHPHSFNAGVYALAVAAGTGVHVKNEEAFRALIWEDDPDEETRRHRIAHYDAEVRYVDALLGRLVSELQHSELLDRTIVLVTSDHGESFFEHGYMQHGPRVDDPVMRVPLVLRLPRGHPDFRQDLSIDALVRTVDIFPTLLDAVGVAPPDGLDGVSLLPAIRGESVPALWAYGENGRTFVGIDPERHLPGVEGKRRMIRTADWKLVYVPLESGAEYRLFDLVNDPEELRDVAASHPERVAELRALLEPILAREPTRTKERQLSGEEIERLRALGYAP